MYTNGSYLAKQVMQVPEELILRKDVSELLPVYMLMYAKYSPFYDLRFYSYTSLSELVELAGTFGKDCQPQNLPANIRPVAIRSGSE